MVDPLNGDIYVATKRSTPGMVFRAPFPQSTTEPITMEWVADLPFGGDSQATGGDISADGRFIIIRRYGDGYIWERTPGSSMADALNGTYCRRTGLSETQGEAVAFDVGNSGTFYTTSEGGGSVPIYRYRNVNDGGGCSDDSDGDGVCDGLDNCFSTSNPGQADGDGDGRGDVCDNCPSISNSDQADLDADQIGDACDPCVDADQDGFGAPGHEDCQRGNSADCDDGDPDTHPSAADVCDSRDNDCSGAADDAVCSMFDANGDGGVDGVDLAWLGRSFSSCSAQPDAEWWGEVDYTGDGCVDGNDLAVLSSIWGCAESEAICP